jgi:hypothetical protein
MLLARLQRHAERRAAGGVMRDADDAPGHLAHEWRAGGEKSGMRAAVAEGHAEALRRADGDVGAERAGGFQQHERKRVHAERHHAAGRMHPGDEP